MSCDGSDSAPQRLSEDAAGIPIEERTVLTQAIDSQRTQLWRAHAITLTAARLLHQTFDFEVGEPDIAYALDAAAQIVVDVIDRLDPTNLHLQLGDANPRASGGNLPAQQLP